MNRREREIDKCYMRWYNKIKRAEIMSRKVQGKKYVQLISVPIEQIEQYEKDGWKIWLDDLQ